MRGILFVALVCLLAGCGESPDPVWNRAIGYWGAGEHQNTVAGIAYSWHDDHVKIKADGTGATWNVITRTEKPFRWAKSKIDDGVYRFEMTADGGDKTVWLVQPLALDSLRVLSESKQQLHMLSPLREDEFASSSAFNEMAKGVAEETARINAATAKRKEDAINEIRTKTHLTGCDLTVSHLLSVYHRLPSQIEFSQWLSEHIDPDRPIEDQGPNDAWGTPLRLTEGQRLDWECRSAGPDLKFGTDDDVVSVRSQHARAASLAADGKKETKESLEKAHGVIAALQSLPDDDQGTRAIDSVLDGFHMPMRYHKENEGRWTITSSGFDLKFGTADDIEMPQAKLAGNGND